MSIAADTSRGDVPRTGVRGYESNASFDVQRVRDDFPILKTTVNGKPLTYLDNGATTQKPRAVIDAISHYYESQNANIHRGVYYLSQLATDLYESARRKARKFINAADDREIIFTRGTTESINLVAFSFSQRFLKAGDEIIVSNLEHHSNIVPWQMACERHGATLRVIPINDAGELLLDEYEKLLKPGVTKLVAVNHLSNSLGTINDVERIARLAHAAGAKMLVDGAQWVAHYPTDVRAIDVDFYAFSSHKLYGPTGIGVLYGKRELLEAMPPYQGGGDMIASVKFEKTLYADLPNKFEAGTPHIAGAVGLGAAIDYVTSVGLDRAAAYEEQLTQYLTGQVRLVPGIRIIGTAGRKGGVCSFVIEDPPLSAHDAGVMLDMEGVAVRTGHHCCQPVMERLGVTATVRASLAMYNTKQDVDALVAALRKITSTAPPKPAPAPATSESQVEYPTAAGSSPQAVADELAEVFEFFGDDANAKSRYLMDDLGAKLPNLFDLLKRVTPRLEGCMSEVYFVGRRSPDDSRVLEFVGDANAAIVRGEVAMLEKLFSGQRARDVLAFDVESFFRRIGLERFLTNQRRTGMASMVKRIRSLAESIEGIKS